MLRTICSIMAIVLFATQQVTSFLPLARSMRACQLDKGTYSPPTVLRMHGGMGGMTETLAPGEKKEYSFVQDDLRTYAMKLHTRDQAPREGQQPAQTPVSAWEPQLIHYTQFLVDSLRVYEALDTIVAKHAVLAPFRSTGLERVQALKEDLAWLTTYDSSLKIPAVGAPGLGYASFLEALAEKSIPQFMCHYYNHYFAHTAGGRMIGKRMGDRLLGGATLKFYQWDGDVKEMLENTRKKVDALAVGWSDAEKQSCLEETMNCFRYGGGLMASMRDPAAASGGRH